MVTGATSITVVTLSRNGDAAAVITIRRTSSRYGCPRERLPAQIPRYSKTPVCLITPTMIIMPSRRKITPQSMPACSE